jgi:hypothetical protein
MISFETGATMGSVNVMTSGAEGHSNEQIVELAMDKIMRVSVDAPPAIRDQAEAFQDNLRQVLYFYIELARREERGTICRMVAKAGQKEMADLIRRL